MWACANYMTTGIFGKTDPIFKISVTSQRLTTLTTPVFKNIYRDPAFSAMINYMTMANFNGTYPIFKIFNTSQRLTTSTTQVFKKPISGGLCVGM